MLDSVLDQTYSEFELIISDNASDDRTPEICQEFARKDPRVRYFRQPANVGAPRNFNFVFEQARGQYFKWAADNDVCDRELLKVCKKVLDERPEVVLCFGKAMAIDQDGRTLMLSRKTWSLTTPDPVDDFATSLTIRTTTTSTRGSSDRRACVKQCWSSHILRPTWS